MEPSTVNRHGSPKSAERLKVALMAEREGNGNDEPLMSEGRRMIQRAPGRHTEWTRRTGQRPARSPGPAFFLSCFWFVESAERQHYHNLKALELVGMLHLDEIGNVGFHLVQQLGADLLVRHLAAAIAQGYLHLVAFFEEALHRPH